MSSMIVSVLATAAFAAAPWLGSEPYPVGFEPAVSAAQVQVTDGVTTLASSLGTEPLPAGPEAVATRALARRTVRVGQGAGSVTPATSLGAEPFLASPIGPERSVTVSASRADRASPGEAAPPVKVARSCSCK